VIHRALLLLLLGALATGARGGITVVGELTGLRAQQPLQSATGRFFVGEPPELRRLELAAAGGALWHAGRLALPGVVSSAEAGSRLATLQETGGLRLVDLTLPEIAAFDPTVLRSTASGDTLAAWRGGSLQFRRLDLLDDAWQSIATPLPDPPQELALAGGRLWVAGADSLRGWRLAADGGRLGAAHLAQGLQRLRAGGDRLLACRGEAGLQVLAIDETGQLQAAAPWQAPGPVFDARHWRQRLWVLALGDSGLALVDLELPAQPMLRGRWRSARPALALDLRADTLLVAEGDAGLSLHRLHGSAGAPAIDLLARHGSRPVPLQLIPDAGPQRAWLLEAGFGLRRLAWDQGAFADDLALGLPLPVLGGDLRDGLFAGASRNAGLRYYQLVGAGLELRGVHPPDPVKLLAWGPDGTIAYVTPTAFVAIKQALRDPWRLLHWGTINLQADPLCAAWSGTGLLVGCSDGRLFEVDAADPASPRLEQVLHLPQAVREIRPLGPDTEAGLLICAGALYSARIQTGRLVLLDSLAAAPGAEVLSAHLSGEGGPGLAAEADPHRLRGFLRSGDGALQPLEIELPLPAAPLRTGVGPGGGDGLVALANGDLLALSIDPSQSVELRPRAPAFGLEAWPNPFNPGTRLRFELDSPARVRLEVVDLLGRRLLALDLGPLRAGAHETILDGASWPAGLHLARLQVGDQTAACKLLLVK
jgi:hypothetical protein